LRPLHLAQPRLAHEARLDQPCRPLAVRARPAAARPARGEALEEVVRVERLALPVDPPEAQRHLEHVGVPDRRLARALLRDLQPDAALVAVVTLEPRLPPRPRRAREHL